jgi:hypothetical protein
MRIRMLRHQYGSPDGVTLLVYEQGHEYDLSGGERALDLAAVFVREGWAVEVKPEPVEPVVEAKAEPEAPENKAIDFAPENKARGRRR